MEMFNPVSQKSNMEAKPYKFKAIPRTANSKMTKGKGVCNSDVIIYCVGGVFEKLTF